MTNRDHIHAQEDIHKIISEMGVAHLNAEIAEVIASKRSELTCFDGDQGDFVDSLHELEMAERLARNNAEILHNVKALLGGRLDVTG